VLNDTAQMTPDRIIATNETPAIRKLIQDYPQEQSGYSIMVMDKNADYLDIQVL
jgi:hypothetical protein